MCMKRAFWLLKITSMLVYRGCWFIETAVFRLPPFLLFFLAVQVKNARVRTGNKAASAAAAAANYTGTMFCQVGEKMLGESNGDLRLAHRVWKVKFSGEGADDCGGAYSESISEMCEELQTPGVLPLLILTPNGLSNNGVNRDCFILNPSLLSQPAGGQAHRENFRFLGILIGIAIRTGAPMNLSLAPPVWKQLVGMALTVRDLEEIDRDYVPSLLHLRWLGAAGLDKLEMPYSTPSARLAAPVNCCHCVCMCVCGGGGGVYVCVTVCVRVCVYVCVRVRPYGAVVCAVDFQSRGRGFNSRRLWSHTSFFSFSFS